MENKELICEVLLNSYKDLGHLIEACNNNIFRCAVNSYKRDVYEAFDVIVELMDRKTMYCNVKNVIDEAISKLKSNIELKYKYILGIRNKDIEEVLGEEESTICNRIKRQKQKVFEYLYGKYTTEQLFALIKDSRVLMNRYRRLCNENN